MEMAGDKSIGWLMRVLPGASAPGFTSLAKKINLKVKRVMKIVRNLIIAGGLAYAAKEAYDWYQNGSERVSNALNTKFKGLKLDGFSFANGGSVTAIPVVEITNPLPTVVEGNISSIDVLKNNRGLFEATPENPAITLQPGVNVIDNFAFKGNVTRILNNALKGDVITIKVQGAFKGIPLKRTMQLSQKQLISDYLFT